MTIAQFIAQSNTVLGMNARNLDYIALYNPPQAIALASNKLETKARLEEAGLPVPATLLTISHWSQVKDIAWEDIAPSFVIKPVNSSQGKGVLVIFGKSKRHKDKWIKYDGTLISKQHIETHLFNILGGSFSRTYDSAFIEERMRVHASIKPYIKRGTPDVRVIVFNGVPVAAQLRLPTLRSQGRSNLHMGGIGVGIDLALGTTTHAIYAGKSTRFLPGTRTLLSSITIPSWEKILLLAVQAQKAIGLGFAGIDISINPEGSPVIVEVNARPGLAIQNAIHAGLKEHLDRIAGLRLKDIRQGVALAQAMFGGNITNQLEVVSGKRVVGVFEPIVIEAPKRPWSITAKLDTGSYTSSIDKLFLKKMGFPEKAVYKRKIKTSTGEKTKTFTEISFSLKGERITTEAVVGRKKTSQYDLLIGRKDLKDFLLDPTLKKPKVV